MKRMFVFCYALVCIALGVKAQLFEITEIRPINAAISEVSAGAQKLRVNHVLRDKISKAPGSYLLAVLVYKNHQVVTIVARNRVSHNVAEVVSVEPTDDEWLVKLSNGYNYSSNDPEWAKVIPGQHVEYTTVLGETWEWERLPHAVSKEVALTDKVQISPAPKAPIVRLDANNRPIPIGAKL